MAAFLSIDVLLVKDDEETAAVFMRLFSTIGGKVRVAKTVAEGISALEREPCLVVLDLMLPDGSSVLVLQKLRTSKLRSKVAVVSGTSDPQLLASVTALRPDAIFGKPLDFADFVDWFNSIAPDLPAFCFNL